MIENDDHDKKLTKIGELEEQNVEQDEMKTRCKNGTKRELHTCCAWVIKTVLGGYFSYESTSTGSFTSHIRCLSMIDALA